MNKLFFRPWVGSSYSTGGIFGKRVMILGESHYCEEGCEDCGNVRQHPECCAFTNSVVSDYLNESLDRQRWMNTYLKFERSLVGMRQTGQNNTDWVCIKHIISSKENNFFICLLYNSEIIVKFAPLNNNLYTYEYSNNTILIEGYGRKHI